MRSFLGRGLLALALAGCNKSPSEEQCRALLEHLVNLEIKRAGAVAADAQKGELEKLQASVVESKLGEYMPACLEKTARTHVECALAASDLDGVAKCDTEGE